MGKSTFLSKVFYGSQAQMEKVKGSGPPWYIISQDNSVLSIFKIVMGLLCLPTVIVNLFL